MARVTLKIIAKKAGISYPNVSKIINNKPVFVSQENREKVLAIARELNYSPNQFAQSLKTGRTNIIGFSTGTVNITSLFQDPYLSNVCTGVADALAQHKYKLIFHYFPRVAEGQSPDIATNQTVDGLIFSLFAHAVDIFLENRLRGPQSDPGIAIP
jgi:LacI family transcriptional regulator